MAGERQAEILRDRLRIASLEAEIASRTLPQEGTFAELVIGWSKLMDDVCAALAPEPTPGEYDAVERDCRGCMGPCGRCHEKPTPDPPPAETGPREAAVRELFDYIRHLEGCRITTDKARYGEAKGPCSCGLSARLAALAPSAAERTADRLCPLSGHLPGPPCPPIRHQRRHVFTSDPPAAAERTEGRETGGWLIERPNQPGAAALTYWSGFSADSWTRKPELAIRFARQQDAEHVRTNLLSGHPLARSAEHLWMGY